MDTQAEEEARVRALAERSLGVAVSGIEPLAAQLGLRRFLRVTLASGPVRTLIARIERPEDPGGRPAGAAPEPPLEPIRALLEDNGLPVPASHGLDDAHGIVLLEDLGDRTLRDAVAAAGPEERTRLYHAVCDLVPRLQRVSDPGSGVAAFRRHLDAELIRYKAELFATWVLASAGPAARACVDAAFAIVADAAREAPQRLAHRDLQSANVHLRADGGPVLIDLQGALLAPPEYDLVCLLHDSYVALDPTEIAAQCERVRPQLPDALAPETFAQRFDLLTLSRKGKDAARFLQAAAERGDDRYLPYVPQTLRAVHEAAARAARRDPRLGDFAELCNEELPRPCAQ